MITIQESHLNHNQLITQRYQSQEEILLEALSYRIVDELKHQAELLISEPVFPMELFEVILDQFFRLNINYLHLLICKSWLQVIKKLERKYPLIVDIASTSQVAMYMTRRGIVYGSGRLNFAIDSAKKKGNVSLRQVLKNAAGGKMFFSMDGIVYCVGENDDFKGKHGAPKLYQVNGLNDIVQVDCFKNRWWADPSTFLFFLTKCGNVLGCGKNYCGQFDIKTKVSWNNKEDFHSTPVLIEGLKDIVQMSSGEEHALFLSRDGQVYGIGRSGCLFGNNFTQLEENLVKINDLNDIVQVECGVDYSLFLNRYGKVFACGKPKFYTPNIVQIAGLEDIVSISAFENHTLFLTKNGDVYGSGCSHNFLPFEENNTRLGVTKIEDLKGIKKIVCGFRHSLFLSKDGKVYGSGKSNDGVLGIATNINQYTVDS